MGVVTIGEVLDSLWDELWLSEEEEADVGDSSTLDIVVDIRDGELEKFLGCLGVHSAGVCATDCIHGALSHDGIFAASHLLDQAVCLLFTALHQ